MPKPEVAAYYCPLWHSDPRNDKWHGAGWTEWELLKTAKPRYPGHRQPIEPAWGCFDESDPAWSQREIDLAADHGLTAFLYDFYWYEDGAFLNGALDRGFLCAPNRDRLKFALMWANHNWHDWHPVKASANAWVDNLLVRGELSSKAFERFTQTVIQKYFLQPNYLRIEGRPYFSIYDLATFMRSYRDLDEAAHDLDRFRKRTLQETGSDLHLNAMVGRFGESASKVDVARRLKLDSVTSYNWYDHYPIHEDSFPRGSYEKAMLANVAAWPRVEGEYGVPYIANITTGWDSSPRCCATDRFENRGYPWIPVLEGDTTEMFSRSLHEMKNYLAKVKPRVPLITINAWNEWTEGAYLLPDKLHDLSRLEAIRDAFGAPAL